MKKFFVVAMMAVAFTGAVQAQSMFRCTKAGVSSYQDKPCDDMVVARPVQGNIVSGLPTPGNAQNVTKLDPSTNKAMTEAYQNHMARGEYATLAHSQSMMHNVLRLICNLHACKPVVRQWLSGPTRLRLTTGT